MDRIKRNSWSIALLASTAIAGAIALPFPVQAQTVADRTLSDVEVVQVGQCKTVTVTFNIRVQMLSYFPKTGRELHVRVRPLDAAQALTRRESLRPPSNLPELRTIDYEGDNPSGPVLSMYFARNVQLEVSPGLDPTELIIQISEPGSSAKCDGAQATGTAPPTGPALAPPAPDIDVPAGLYVINLLSQSGKIGELKPGQREAITGKIVYESLFQRNAEEWHRLRLGFFSSRSAAEAAKAALIEKFPGAWVVKISPSERNQGVANRLDYGPIAPARTTPQAKATPGQAEKAVQLVRDAEAAIRDGNPGRAIQILTKAVALPQSEHTPRALELLGLTREREGQKAQAIAEYEEYLRRFPKNEGANRVRQRLAALSGGPGGGSLRAASSSGSRKDWTWGARGSLSQFYFRDQSSTKFVDASRPTIDPEIDNSVNVNQLLSSGDITITGGNDRRQIEMRASGAYTKNFRNGGRDIKSLTSLYLDYSDEALHSRLRVGRQTRNSAGVLGRFDGALMSFRANPKLRFSVVGGFPVLSSRQTHILNERYFYGASLDVGARRSPVQATVYWFDQRAKGGFIDRQSVGFEGRILKPRFNAFTIVDYDVKFKKLNLGLLTLNYAFPDRSNLSVTADYRHSPLLTTSNALIGQIDSTSLLPIIDLRGLRPFFTDSEIYQLAQDRTIVTKSLTASYSRPISTKLQVNADFTVTNTGGTPGTPASSGTLEVFAIPASGTDYFYGVQFVGTGLFWKNDIYILSGRYADTQRNWSYTADFNARVPITSSFRISPRVRYGYRSEKLVSGNFRQLQPTLRMNFYPKRNIEAELEVGGNFSNRKEDFNGALSTTKESGIVINLGYRVDF